MKGSVMRLGETIPDTLASCSVFDPDGGPIALSSFWSNGPALLVFLRHFGCIGCSEQVAGLVPRLDEMDGLGIRTVFIGNGAPHFIENFIERFALSERKVEIVTDPGLAAYAAAGLRRSAWAAFGPVAIFDVLRAFGQGHINRIGEGDNLQQGGAVLVDTDGTVAWHQRSRSLGGHAPAVEIVDAAMRLIMTNLEPAT